jgi:PUA domain protein
LGGQKKQGKFTVSKRYRLSKKELKAFKRELEVMYPTFNTGDLKDVEYAKIGEIEFYIINKIPAFFKFKRGILIPTLIFLLKNREQRWLPRVIVDRGATRALARGADLMVPGIREVDEFKEEEIVVIVDEESRVPVAVGRAILSSAEIVRLLETVRKGKAIENIHYPGDEVWEASKIL